MSSNLPYFIKASEFDKLPGTDKYSNQDPSDQHSVYPDLTQANGAESMYALADGAMQAHQERNQFANLVQAAEAANELQIEAPMEALERRGTRKRKRQVSDGTMAHDEEEDSMHQEPVNGGIPHASSAATALFRKPSASSKKYTRLPMSHLYSKLELAPENFLQLQSKAKSYMLDPEHLERQDTVGQRGKGDSELVKLRLWNSVKTFLEEEGNGIKFFGPNETGENGTTRTMIWPQDKNAIISAITPLMRRMVTNERQRKYAVETRKGGTEQPESKKKKTDPTQESQAIEPGILVNYDESEDSKFTPTSRALFREVTAQDIETYPIAKRYIDECDPNDLQKDPTLQAHRDTFLSQSKALEPEVVGILSSIDSHLRNFHLDGLLESRPCTSDCESEFVKRIASSSIIGDIVAGDPSDKTEPVALDSVYQIIFAAYRYAREMVARTSSLTVDLRPLSSAPQIQHAEPTPASHLKIHVSHVCAVTGGRLGPRREISADTAPYLHTVAQVGTAYAGPTSLVRQPRVRVLTHEGLKVVKDDKEWTEAVEIVRGIPWFDGLVTVLVDYGAKSASAMAGIL